MSIDRLSLLEWLLPYCEPNTVCIMYPKGKSDGPGWVNGQEHSDRARCLSSRLREINEVRKEISQGRQEMFNTCDSPELDEQYEDVEAEMLALAKVNQE